MAPRESPILGERSQVREEIARFAVRGIVVSRHPASPGSNRFRELSRAIQNVPSDKVDSLRSASPIFFMARHAALPVQFQSTLRIAPRKRTIGKRLEEGA